MAIRDAITPGRVPASAYPRFVESAEDYAIFFLDPQGNVSSWSAGAERAKGYSEKEILGKHFSVFYPPREIADHKPQFVLKVAEREGRYSEEAWRVRKDGTMFWASVSITALRNERGELIGFGKVTRDLTDRKHQEEALRRSEERHRLLVESVKDYAIFVLDPQGRIMTWNEGARRLKGYEAEEIIGEHFSRFYTATDIARNHPQHELDLALRDGRFEEEGWRVRKDGGLFWANVTITALLDSSGRHVGFAKVTRDLTARKRAEEELRQRAILYASLNRELDAFSHTVAHDLRSPIRAIEHLTSVLLDEEGSMLSDDGKNLLRSMNATARGMARTVQDLLELSTAKARDVARTRVDVSALAREIAAEARSREPGRAIDVRVENGLVADADKDLLRIALANLIGNAVKFTRNESQALVEVGRRDAAEGPAFFVRDNGAGFDSTRVSQLFQPFSRLHAAHEFEGTGIGLATVARIVRRHGGKVWAEGEPGKGATFWFTLPEAIG